MQVGAGVMLNARRWLSPQSGIDAHDLMVAGAAAGIAAAFNTPLGGIVFALVGIDAPVFWGVVMGFFCLVPLGAWVVWAPAAALLAKCGFEPAGVDERRLTNHDLAKGGLVNCKALTPGVCNRSK